ncbi:uncharacterized protein MONOS_14498 [Monocercomonoides exilis]|uniref:uncharacterized protein n=1 Tax=Monocercomonoides exilis TaxID=2049356 RepID=UPI0035599CCE|nr:hypothetical protein MONOS_14498 [Monocercomonoides exilis]|eukprot:MONOS_14498.1-p1 / transcript=MONOS_14498.1 / gene=MONOS_14498 / organism=Monocercomonoides_exilis_PA203 / gene_product=unspecified product / transcript_product=unspecified product / location=Mono_scaffold01013:17333-18759(+) / protein_length=435 / sequence_SO=supercontig / SO=protein_coding / is_pseudo=false
MCDEAKSNDDVQEPSLAEKFSKLLRELEHYNEIEQKHTILEMNGMVEEMSEEEFRSIFTIELFDTINRMIEEMMISMENAILLLKHVGYYKELKCFICYSFDYSSLRESMKEMIIDENEKKKDEKLLTDLCECFALLGDDDIFDEILSIVVPCLLKIASKKEESKKVQKEMEMSLLALSCIDENDFIEQKLYLNEIKEIIKYRREHHNLTRLAYQSAWKFLIYRSYNDESFTEVIVNELHFVREAAKELEDLSKCMDWKRKEERGKETEDEIVLMRWFEMLEIYFRNCRSWNEEYSGLIRSISQVYRASRDNCFGIQLQCLYSLREAAENKDVKTDNFLESGTIGLYLEEIQRPTLDDKMAYEYLLFFTNVSKRLKIKEKDEKVEAKRKATKMESFGKMEEEGYEDVITSFHGIFDFLNSEYGYELSTKISDYN